jgi:hypothetical protein
MEAILTYRRIRSQSKVSLCCEKHPILPHDGKSSLSHSLGIPQTNVPAAEQRIAQLQ